MPQMSTYLIETLKKPNDIWCGDWMSHHFISAPNFKTVCRVFHWRDARLSWWYRWHHCPKQQFIKKPMKPLGLIKKRVLIKIAGNGIDSRQSAIEQQGIHCNVTLLFGLHRQSPVPDRWYNALISPFVRTILDWQKKMKESIASKSAVIKANSVKHSSLL